MNFWQRLLRRLSIAYSREAADKFIRDAAKLNGQINDIGVLQERLALIAWDIVFLALRKKVGDLSEEEAQAEHLILRRTGGTLTSEISSALKSVENPRDIFFVLRQARLTELTIIELARVADAASKLFLVADTFAERSYMENDQEQDYWSQCFIENARNFFDARIRMLGCAIAHMKKGHAIRDFRKCLTSYAIVDKSLFELATREFLTVEGMDIEELRSVVRQEAARTRAYISDGRRAVAKQINWARRLRNQPMASKINSVLTILNDGFAIEEEIVQAYSAIIDPSEDSLSWLERWDELTQLLQKRMDLVGQRRRILIQ